MNADNIPDTVAVDTLLLIDDELANLKVLESYLEHYGFDMMVARSGETGIEKAKEGQPDLILLDIRMPGLNGFETCKILKADETTQKIPIIFLSALYELEDKIQGFEIGGVDFITKPVQEKELLVRINTHLELKKLREKLENENDRLHNALDVGSIVNVAVGVLMERYKLTKNDAVNMLRHRARSERRKINLVAEELLNALDIVNSWSSLK